MTSGWLGQCRSRGCSSAVPAAAVRRRSRRHGPHPHQRSPGGVRPGRMGRHGLRRSGTRNPAPHLHTAVPASVPASVPAVSTTHVAAVPTTSVPVRPQAGAVGASWTCTLGSTGSGPGTRHTGAPARGPELTPPADPVPSTTPTPASSHPAQTPPAFRWVPRSHYTGGPSRPAPARISMTMSTVVVTLPAVLAAAALRPGSRRRGRG